MIVLYYMFLVRTLTVSLIGGAFTHIVNLMEGCFFCNIPSRHAYILSFLSERVLKPRVLLTHAKLIIHSLTLLNQ